jgi:hypothetical protein
MTAGFGRASRSILLANLLLATAMLQAQQPTDFPTSTPTIGQAVSPAPLPPLSPRPSAFAHDLISPTSRNAPSVKTPPTSSKSKQPPAGWVRRLVTDWLHRGNHVESSGSFFTRIRQEERNVSDSLLVSRCRSLLVSDAAVRAAFIHILAENGVITLRGHVASDAVRQQAEQLARNTVGLVNVRNELEINPLQGVEQTSYAAMLAPPIRLDGGTLAGGLPTPPNNFLPAEPTPAFSESPLAAGTVSASLAPFIEPMSPAFPASSRTPRQGPTLSVAMMPSIKHRTLEQQVAKPFVPQEVLPSGQKIGSGKRTIPAPPLTPSVQVPAVIPAGQASASVEGDRLAQQIQADVAAILARDPRARQLSFTIRGKEVRLAGGVAKSEDLFELADLIDRLPGIDFVSFDEVQFQNP